MSTETAETTNIETAERRESIRSLTPLTLAGLVRLYEGLERPERYARMFGSVQGRKIMLSLGEAIAYEKAVQANYVRCTKEEGELVSQGRMEAAMVYMDEGCQWFAYLQNLRAYIFTKQAETKF